MKFTEYLNEASKYIENGNGSKTLEGKNLNLHVWSNVHNKAKRLSVSIETVKNSKNSSSTWRGEELKSAEDSNEWEQEVQQKIIKELKSDFDALDEKISKLYDKHLGTNREKE